MGYISNAPTLGGNSTITTIYGDFFSNSSWKKYYDKYSGNLEMYNYSQRILGDATGEMGPFSTVLDPDSVTRYINSWYSDYSYFPQNSSSWFLRGGFHPDGLGAGIFSFHCITGENAMTTSFRVVLTPKS